MLAEFEKISCNDEGGFKVAYLNDKGGFLHFHPEFELVLNLKSYGTRIIGDSVELFDRYDMTLISDNMPHSWNHYKQNGKVPENHGLICNFRLSSLGEKFLSQHEMRSVTELLKDSARGIAFSIDDAHKAEEPFKEMVCSTGLKKIIWFFRLLEILCSSEKRRYLCSENYEPATDERLGKRMTDTYSYIRENIHKPLSLKEISKVADMSPYSFSRYFKKNSGSGFVEYVNQVRLNKACYLLRETDHQVQDIASDCGFASISNFNKQFRKSISTSPGDYREQFR
jgi:AraC-like DNA-binding protein